MIQRWGVEEIESFLLGPKKTIHFNVMYKGSGMASRLHACDIRGSRPSEIEWIMLVEAGRKATLVEIRKLCDGQWKE